MAKIFDVDFRTGSMVDRVSGLSGTNNNCRLQKAEKGMSAYCNGASAISYLPIVLGSTFSAVVSFKYLGSRIGDESPFGSDSTQVQLFRIRDGYLQIYAISSAYPTGRTFSTGLFLTYGNTYHIIYTVDSTGISVYYNGVFIIKDSNNWGIFCTYTYLAIGVSGVTDYFKGNIYNAQLYNHILTEAERAKAYSDFLNSHPLEVEKYPKHLDVKPNDLSYLKEGKLTDELLVTDPTYGFVANRADKWTPQGSNTVEQEGNAVKITYVSNIYGAVQKISAAVGNVASNPIIGNYQLVIRAKAIGSVSLIWFDGVGAYPGVLLSSEYVTYVVNFPINHATNAGLQFGNMGAGEVAWVEIISLKQKVGLVAAYNMRPVGNQLIDISGSGKNLTINNTPSFKDGIIIKNDSTISSGGFVNSTVYTIHCVFKRNSFLGSFNTLFLNLASSLNNSYFIDTASNLYFRHSAGNIFNVAPVLGTLNKTVLTIVANGTTISVYVNGVLTGSTTPNSTSFNFRYLYHDSYKWDREIYDLRVYDYALSESEVKAYHNSFAKHVYLQENFALEGADGVAKVPSGWSKVSGSFKVNEWVPAVSSLIDYSNLLTTGGFSKTSDNTFSYTASIVTSYIVRLSFLTIGRRYLTKFRCISNPNNTQVRLEAGGTSYYKDTLTLAPKEGVTYSYDGGGGAQTTDFRFRVSVGQPSGLIVDNVEIIELPPLPTFNLGTKYLEGSGVIAIPSTQSSGTYEFDFYAANNQALRINAWSKIKDVYSDSGNGYMVYIVAGIIYFYKVTGSVLFNTASNYISYTTWYRLKVTRSTSGVFTFYIKGGAFGTANWTLVSTAGGLGTNPVTDNTYNDSRYFVIKSEHSLHRIANIKLTEGIEA